jgi:hypothetical protein
MFPLNLFEEQANNKILFFPLQCSEYSLGWADVFRGCRDNADAAVVLIDEFFADSNSLVVDFANKLCSFWTPIGIQDIAIPLLVLARINESVRGRVVGGDFRFDRILLEKPIANSNRGLATRYKNHPFESFILHFGGMQYVSGSGSCIFEPGFTKASCSYDLPSEWSESFILVTMPNGDLWITSETGEVAEVSHESGALTHIAFDLQSALENWLKNTLKDTP